MQSPLIRKVSGTEYETEKQQRKRSENCFNSVITIVDFLARCCGVSVGVFVVVGFVVVYRNI